MNKNLFTGLLTLGVGLVLAGLWGGRLGGLEVCIEPYILFEGSCCLDGDGDLACDKYQRFESGWETVNATATYREGLFNVTNNDVAPWDNCMAEIDARWMYRCGSVPAGSTFFFDNNDVRGMHGELMTREYRPNNITIYATQGIAFKSLK